MTGFVVTEGKWDKRLMQMVLDAQGIEFVEVVEGRGRSSTVSTATSLLAKYRMPVVLFLDADTVVERLVAVQRQELGALLRYSSPDDRLWHLVLCKPALEAVLFEVVGFDTGEAFGIPLNERQKAVAPYNPKEVLEELGGPSWRDKLTDYLASHPEVCRQIGETPTFKPLIQFLRAHQQVAA